MITAVYFEFEIESGAKARVLDAVFLLREDAERYSKRDSSLRLKDVDAWEDWTKIKDAL